VERSGWGALGARDGRAPWSLLVNAVLSGDDRLTPALPSPHDDQHDYDYDHYYDDNDAAADHHDDDGPQCSCP
jgi:hypothetical protein